MRQGVVPRLVAAALLAGGYAWGAEYAVLETGFRIRATRHEMVHHETAGELVRLYSGDGKFIELPAAAVARFEHDDYVPPLPEPAKPVEPFDLDETLRRLARIHQVPPELIHSIIAAESAFDPQAVSPKGAVGLMQLMPETARELAVENPHDPHQNVTGGVNYFKQLLERYTGTPDQLVRALAAYNAGPGAVERYDGLPPYAETRAFVRRVIERFLAMAEAN
jgi:soluble lytic murein transglycosylase-like protein